MINVLSLRINNSTFNSLLKALNIKQPMKNLNEGSIKKIYSILNITIINLILLDANQKSHFIKVSYDHYLYFICR